MRSIKSKSKDIIKNDEIKMLMNVTVDHNNDTAKQRNS